jgi:hypothetical protein
MKKSSYFNEKRIDWTIPSEKKIEVEVANILNLANRRRRRRKEDFILLFYRNIRWYVFKSPIVFRYY